MEKIYLTTSLEDTQDLAKKILQDLKSGTTICLIGELASGKTTFTQGLGNALGLSRVTSPTYMIMREYNIENHPFIKRLFHLDLYRLSTVEEIRAFDLEEIWSDPNNLVVIEWPEKVFDQLPQELSNQLQTNRLKSA